MPTAVPTRDRLPRVGDRIVIERDENTYPARGSWRQWRGPTATVVLVNADERPSRTEYGVTFGAARETRAAGGPRTPPVWFLAHELTILGPRRATRLRRGPEMDEETKLARFGDRGAT